MVNVIKSLKRQIKVYIVFSGEEIKSYLLGPSYNTKEEVLTQPAFPL